VPVDLVVPAGDGSSLAVRDHLGEGPAVVLLHGLGDHLVAMRPLAELLLERHRVVSMDLRWSGQSGAGPAFSWEVLVHDVDALCGSLGLGPTFVVGHSLGGIVATRYGVAHPDALGVVNLDGWGFGDPALYDGMTEADALATIERLRSNVDPLAAFARECDASWAEGVRGLLRPAAIAKGVREADLDEWVDRAIVDVGDGSFRLRPDPVAYDSMRSDADVFVFLRLIEVPTLVLTSDVDVAQSDVVAARRRGVARRLEVIQERNPHVEVHSIAGANHDSLVTSHVSEVASRFEAFAARG
jgi:pimeloyl-ACP methyl ester carboxylesterase